MDKIKQYQSCIEKVMERYRHFKAEGYDEWEMQLVKDDVNRHYYIMRVGWKAAHRMYKVLFHIDIKENKLWIQEDWIEQGVANLLVDMGIPPSSIVLAFHPPYKRPYTNFAVA